MPKLDIYDWDGVDLVNDPYQRRKGSLESAQNVEFSRVGGRGALRKRAGLVAINSSAVSTPIRGLIGVPLPALGQQYIFHYAGGGTGWRVSTDGGTTWGYVASDHPLASYAPRGGSDRLSAYAAAGAHEPDIAQDQILVGRQVFFPGGAATSKGVRGYDHQAQLAYELATLPGQAEAAGSGVPCGPLFTHHNKVYVGAYPGGYGGGLTGVQMYAIDPVQGTLTAAGAIFAADSPGNPISGVSYLGKAWVGLARAAGARLYYIRDGDSAWTLERTAGAAYDNYTSLCVYEGELFAATQAVSGTAAIIEKRTAAGTWSTAVTGTDTSQSNWFNGLVVFNGNLYAEYGTSDDSVNNWYQYDGASWTVDRDLAAANSTRLNGRIVARGSLFLSLATGTANGIWKRTTGGTWSRVDTTVGEGYFFSPD